MTSARGINEIDDDSFSNQSFDIDETAQVASVHVDPIPVTGDNASIPDDDDEELSHFNEVDNLAAEE